MVENMIWVWNIIQMLAILSQYFFILSLWIISLAIHYKIKKRIYTHIDYNLYREHNMPGLVLILQYLLNFLCSKLKRAKEKVKLKIKCSLPLNYMRDFEVFITYDTLKQETYLCLKMNTTKHRKLLLQANLETIVCFLFITWGYALNRNHLLCWTCSLIYVSALCFCNS